MRAAEALGPVAGSAPTRVSDGAAVRIANVAPNTPTVVTAESLFLSGTGTPDGPGGVGTGALRNTGGNNTWNGPIQLTDIPNFAPTTNPGHQVAFGVNSAADVLSVGPTAGVTEDFATYGQFGLIKVGPGVLTLTTANQYTGVTNVNEGTVRAANNGALGANPPDFVPTAAKPVSPSSEVQTIRVFGTGGYTLTVNGSPTGGLTSNPAGVSSTAAQVQAAIEAVIAGNPATDGATVFVSSTPNSNGNVYTVTFRGRYSGQNVPQLGVIGVASGVTVTIATQQEGGLGTVVASGASLELEGNGLKVSEALTINGPGVTDPNGIRYGALGNRGGDNTYEGTVTLGSATSMGAQPGSDLVVTGRVLGRPIDPTATPNPTTPAAAELTKVGYGTVRFEDDPLTAAVTGDKEYRGRTVIAEGALVITTAGGLGVGRNEVQRLRVTGALGAEKFTLTLLGETTDTILLQAGAAGANAIKTALTSPRSGGNPEMLTAADVDVVVDPDNATIPVGGGVGEAVFLVTFKGRLANTNVPLLTDISPSTPQSTPTLLVVDTTTQGLPPSPTGANEVQTVEIPRQGGTFTLAGVSGVNGNPATFDFDVTLAALQAAFDNANAPFGGPVGARNTSLTQTILPGNTGRLITITYQNASGNQNVSQITGTFTPSLLVRIQGVEDGVGSETQLIDVRNPVGLQYTLTYTNPLTGQVVNGTRLIGATATAATFQAALTDAIGAGGLGIGAGNVLVTRTASAGGFQYLVQFQGSLANVNVLPISATIVNGGANIVVTPVAGGYEGQDGFEGTVVNAGASLQVRNLPAISSEWVTLNGQGRSEAQAFTYTRTAAAGGTFTLQYTGTDGVVVTGTRLLTLGSADGTVPSSTAAEFAAALTDPVGAGGLGLPAGSVFVTRTDVLNGVRFEVQFTGALASVNFPQVVSTVPANGTRLDETLETGGGGALRMLDSTGNFTTVWGNPANVSPLILGSNASIGVESDTDVLRLVLPTTDRNPYSPPTAVLGPTNVRGPNQGFALTKVGAGTLEFNAAGDNDYTGATLVNDGTLLLNHTGAGSHDAVRGPLVVGDGLNPAGTATATPQSQSAVVRLSASNQIADAPTVTVNADGLLDLHGWVETIGNLTINNGVVDTEKPTVPAFPSVPAGASVAGPELTTGTITMTGGRLTVENGDDLLAGTVAAPAAVVMNGAQFEVGTSAAATATIGTLTATNSSQITVGPSGRLTSGTIDLTGSSLLANTGATVDTQGASITARRGPAPGFVNSVVNIGLNATLTTVGAGGRGDVTLIDSVLGGGDNSMILIGALTLNKDTTLPAVGSTASFAAGATLDTGGEDITINESHFLATGAGVIVNPTSPEGRFIATGTAADRSFVVFGPNADANFRSVSLTLTDLELAQDAALQTTGTTAPDQGVALVDSTAFFNANASLTTAAGGLTLTRSTLTGTSGVDIVTQAVQLLDNSTLSLGTGTAALPATLNTNGNAITVNASTLRTGATPDQTTPATIETGGGALTATGTVARRSVVDLGAGTTSNVGPASLTLTDLTTGAGARLNAGTVTAADSTLVTGSSSFTNTGTVSLTDSDLSFGAGSTNAVTGNLTTFDTPATANDSNVTFGTGSTTTVTGAASATNAALILQANAAVTAGTLALSESLADLGTGATLSVSGPVSVAATANGSATSGAGTLRLTGAAAQTVTVLDGAANEDFTIGSGLTATNGQTVVKAGTGRLTLAPAGTTLTTLLQVDAGDAQVNTVTGPVQVSAGGTVSGNGTTGPITLPSTTGVGTVSPGNGWGPDVSGILTANGDVSFGPTSTLYLNIIGDGSSNAGTQQPGTHYDQLFVNGKVNIAPGATLSGLVDTATVRLSNRFIVVRATDTITGTFAELPSSPGFVFIDGYKFDITYTVDPSTGHNLVVLDKVKVNTTTTLSSLNAYSALNGSPSTIEQPVTFKAVVTAEPGSRVPPPNTTFIEFFEDTGAGRVSLGRVPIAVGGIAELTTRDLSAGTHTITADYIVDGDLILDNDDFNQSTSNPVTQIVEQPAVSIALASPVPAPISPANPSPASVGVNDTLQLTAAVTSERSSYTPTFTVSTPGGTVVYRQVLPTVARVQPLNTSSFTATWDGTYNVGPNAGLFVPDGDYRAVITISDEWDRTPLTPTATTAPVTVRVDNTNPTTSGAVDALVINPGNATAPPPAQTAFSGTIVDDNVGTWTVTVTDSTGATVKVFPGSGPTVNVIWDGTDTGGATVADGRYTLTLVTTDAGGNTNFGTPVVRTVYVLRTAPVVTLSTGLGAATGPTTYGEAVTVRARVDLPAFVQAADKNTLLSGKTVTFDFPGTGTLTTTLPVNPAGGVFVASAVVPLNLAAGTYSPIVATFPATAELPVSTASGSHTVNRAALRVTGGNASREYGEPNPAFTYTVNTADLKFADTAAVVSGSPGTPATPASPVGSYAVNQGQGPGAVTALPNYDVVFTNGTLTVTPAAATIRVNDATRVRFAQNPPFTAVVDGLKLGDTAAVLGTLNLVTTAQTNSPIGTYTITLGSAPANANYTYAVVPGTLTVTGSANVTVVGSGEDSPPQVQVLSPAGEKLQNIAYGPTFNGGIRVASADFNKDGVADYVIGSGPGRVAFVQVIDGATGDTLFQAFPFESAFVGGVFVAAGDMTGDGVAELVVTPDEGGGPRVVIYNGGNNFSSLVSYFAIDDPAFRGGVRPAVGDIDGDGFADLVVSAGFGGGPRISVWNGEKLGKLEFVNMINDFFAFEDTLRNGAFVSVGDANGDGIGDLFVGAGPGGGPRVKLYDGRSLLSVGGDRATVVANFFAGNEANRGGVKVAAKNLDGDKFIDLVTGGGKGDRAVATAYRGSALVTNNPVALYEFDLDGTLNGVFVG